jgi:hypothetical protein
MCTAIAAGWPCGTASLVRAVGSGELRFYRYYMFYGIALFVSLFALFMKMRLLVYKLRRRRTPLAHFFSNDFDLAERLDINKQYMTKALLYLLVACGEVRHIFLLACISADSVAGRLPPACDECTVLQDIPNSVLTMLYIVEMGVPPSTMVLLSFATSLTYLGCALRVLCFRIIRAFQAWWTGFE